VAVALFPLSGRWQKFRRERWESAERARLLSSLLNDAPPAGTVALEEDNTKARSLASSSDCALFNHPLTEGAGARRRLLALAKFDPRTDTIDDRPSTRQHSILFSHERRTATGPARLVIVEGIVNWETSSPGQTHLLPLATTFATDTTGPTPLKPTSESEGPMIDGQLAADATWAIRIFAGEADPKDASHFWIDYETSAGAKGTIDGWLRQTSNAVAIKDDVELRLR